MQVNINNNCQTNFQGLKFSAKGKKILKEANANKIGYVSFLKSIVKAGNCESEYPHVHLVVDGVGKYRITDLNEKTLIPANLEAIQNKKLVKVGERREYPHCPADSDDYQIIDVIELRSCEGFKLVGGLFKKVHKFVADICDKCFDVYKSEEMVDLINKSNKDKSLDGYLELAKVISKNFEGKFKTDELEVLSKIVNSNNESGYILPQKLNFFQRVMLKLAGLNVQASKVLDKQ